MSWRAHTSLLALGGFLAAPAFTVDPEARRIPVRSAASCPAVGSEIVDLAPTGAVPMAGGSIELKPLMSPFGVSVTVDGRYQYDASATVKNLPAPSTLGDGYTTWVLWVATPSLDKIRNLGAIKNGQPITARVDFTKMMYMVSAEKTASSEKFNALVLVGRSASARVMNLAGCDIYDEQSRMGG